MIGTPARTMRVLQQHSIIVLLALLLGLALLIELIRPGSVNGNWVSNILLFAAPLGILVAGQHLVVLTGGIDLYFSSAALATPYLLASHSPFGLSLTISLRTF